MLLKHILQQLTDIKALTTIVFITILVTSCATPPTGTNTQGITNSSSLDALLAAAEKAEQQPEPLKAKKLVEIAQYLVNLNEHSSAKKIFNNIDSNQLDHLDYFTYTVIGNDIHLTENSLYQARTLLSSRKLEEMMGQLSINQQQQIHRMKAELFQRTGESISSLYERIALGTLLYDSDELQQNNNAIWQELSSFTLYELITLSDNITDSTLSNWLALATISKQHQHNLELQSSNISDWVNNNPDHPASNHLPDEIALLQELILSKPNNIALLLPLQGKLAKAGQAIRDGFMAAYYLNKDNQQNQQVINFYNTSGEDINSVYNQAVANGAKVIIGPLTKENVRQLQQRDTLSVPTLALNYLDEDSQATDNENTNTIPLYQFGLSVEDEARQVADRAWLEGHRKALIISTKTGSTERAVTAFTQRWQEYGGQIIAHKNLADANSYSSDIEHTLQIDKSKARAKELKKLFRRSFEFEPRRRADIDMVFLVTRSQQGRQIKPTLNFHYASNIPVYATSQIYSSANNKTKNSDLNDIKLSTLPWIINNESAEKNLIEDHIKVNASYDRLYALGADSFLLYPRLKQLYELQQQLYGATGQLSVDQNKRIIRKQLWAKVVGGQLEPLRALTLFQDNAL